MAPPVRQTHGMISVPAPIGGVNLSAPLAAMPASDAVSLVNWIPDKYGVRTRKGYREWAINIPGALPVEGFLSYFSSSDTFPASAFLTVPSSMPGKLFCATKYGIYDITDATDTPTEVVSLSGSDYAGWFSSCMLTNSADTWLLAVSETDGYYTYDGATWVKRLAGSGGANINGVDPANFAHVSVWKRRAWFCQRDSTKVWYLPVDSVAGTASAFDFGPLLEHGGHVAFTASWTIDAGEGIDDLFVVVGSNGDVLVYKGTDPSSASTFELVGAWFVGQMPVGRRAYTQYGGDLVLVSSEGVYPLSYVTRGGAGLLNAADQEYSSKIRSGIGEDMSASFTMRGWEAMVHPRERLLIVNVPDHGSVRSRQWAMSTALNSWCQFSGIPIYCIGSTAGYAFAGTRDGRVLLLLTGGFDAVAYGASVGVGIRGVVMPAFNAFGSAVHNKMMHMIRVNLLSGDVPGLEIGANFNYALRLPTGTPSFPPSSAARWDVSSWDTATWAGSQKPYSQWTTVGGIGFAAAASVVSNTIGDTLLTSIDYLFQGGGIL